MFSDQQEFRAGSFAGLCMGKAQRGLRAGAALTVLLVLFLGPPGARAAPPDGGFSLPLACAPGRDCWIMNYADVDPGGAARDFTCGPRAYDGHRGTDFAIRDLATMQAGVDVIAVADGIVLRRRDGMADTGRSGRTTDDRDCGNGVIVDHGDGWTSQYCHLRRGSLAVGPGQRVARGARLGSVGLSGRSAFPHVHLTLRHGGKAVDPFTGQTLDGGCGMRGTPLWRGEAAAVYDAGRLYAAGFSTGRVRARQVLARAEGPRRLALSSPALVLWGAAFGVRKGDRLHLAVTDPENRPIIEHQARLPRDRAWHIAFAGAKRPDQGWVPGTYRGRVRHMRAGRTISERRVAVRMK